MKGIEFTLVQEVDQISPELMVLPATAISNEILTEIGTDLGLRSPVSFAADKGEQLILYSGSASNGDKYLLGLGNRTTISTLEACIAGFFRKSILNLPDKFWIDVDTLLDQTKLPIEEALPSIVFGVHTGLHNIGHFKSEEEELTYSGKIQLKSSDPEAADVLKRSLTISKVLEEIRDLVNAPANKMTPAILSEWMKKQSPIPDLTVTIFGQEEIIKRGLHALYAVGKGSSNPPFFVVAEYKSNPDNPTIGLVGKGVTFDTGGLSIKPSQSMHLMKSDMAGAAAVLGATCVVAELKLPVNLIAIVPAAENSVDAESTRPGDVIESHSGKTIEVTDTDAEGRLILADGLSYLIKDHKPDLIVDMATLTGSCIRALGFEAAGIFSNNDELIDQLVKAGESTGERLWRFPLWPEYDKYLKSDIADLKNFSGKPEAGAISAAKFLEAFTEDHSAWAHVDMAGTAFGADRGGEEKSATGYGLRLLVSFISNLNIQKIREHK